MKRIFSVILIFAFTNVYSQISNKIFTVDIDNFWEAYDSIQNTNEYSKKIDLINQLVY